MIVCVHFSPGGPASDAREADDSREQDPGSGVQPGLREPGRRSLRVAPRRQGVGAQSQGENAGN